MAINKAQTPVWMKAVLVVLAIVFVFGFISIGASPFMTDSTQQQTTTPAAGSLDAVNQQFQPTVSALTAQLQSDPESYTVLVSLGNTYFDWAAQIQQASQTTTANVGADQPIWVAAKDAYSRALAVKEGESPVTVDYAITLFYTGETTKAINTIMTMFPAKAVRMARGLQSPQVRDYAEDQITFQGEFDSRACLHQTHGVCLLDLIKKAEIQPKSSAYCNSSSTTCFM